ncbi:MAG: hypothetical protein EOO43_01920 [Flavobacterium sp.]|nr:MAG: hypothetical protein EOO43_01920 [Flavobacterium sp.]
MNGIEKIRKTHAEDLEKHCLENEVNFQSIQKLLEAEKTKKLLKRNALIQQNIDREIDNALEDEN